MAGLADADPLTTDSVCELEELPPRLLVLGGGPVGCELGQAFARLGSRVTLVERSRHVGERRIQDVPTWVGVRTGACHTVTTTEEGHGYHMTEVADGVFDVKLRFVHAFVVIDDDGVTVIDTGTPGNVEAIAAVVARAHRRLEQVHTILVTHRHADHAGSLAALKRRTGARVYVHADDVPVVTGESPEPAGGFVRKVLRRVLPSAQPTPVDQPLHGGERIGAVEVLHTPGHTPGHLSFLLLRDGGVLFAGDAAGSSRGRVKPPPALMTDDPARARSSLQRLAKLDFRVACFGHGRVLRDGAAARFREFAMGERSR